MTSHISLHQIPYDALYHLSLFLDPTTRQQLGRTCQRFRQHHQSMKWKITHVVSDARTPLPSDTDSPIPFRVFMESARYSWFPSDAVRTILIDADIDLDSFYDTLQDRTYYNSTFPQLERIIFLKRNMHVMLVITLDPDNSILVPFFEKFGLLFLNDTDGHSGYRYHNQIIFNPDSLTNLMISLRDSSGPQILDHLQHFPQLNTISFHIPVTYTTHTIPTSFASISREFPKSVVNVKLTFVDEITSESFAEFDTLETIATRPKSKLELPAVTAIVFNASEMSISKLFDFVSFPNLKSCELHAFHLPQNLSSISHDHMELITSMSSFFPGFYGMDYLDSLVDGYSRLRSLRYLELSYDTVDEIAIDLSDSVVLASLTAFKDYSVKNLSELEQVAEKRIRGVADFMMRANLSVGPPPSISDLVEVRKHAKEIAAFVVDVIISPTAPLPPRNLNLLETKLRHVVAAVRDFQACEVVLHQVAQLKSLQYLSIHALSRSMIPYSPTLRQMMQGRNTAIQQILITAMQLPSKSQALTFAPHDADTDVRQCSFETLYSDLLDLPYVYSLKSRRGGDSPSYPANDVMIQSVIDVVRKRVICPRIESLDKDEEIFLFDIHMDDTFDGWL